MQDPLDRLAAQITSGMKLAVPVDYGGVPMALTRMIIAAGVHDLHLVCVPTGGMQVDMMIGAGLVKTVETSAVSLGEAGGAPQFNAALRAGRVAMMDATCPAIHAGLLAAQKGVPFVPIRGLMETDVLVNRPDWRVINNPMADGTGDDPIVLIPAIHPDAAIFHAPMADRFGNVWIGRRRELAAMAYSTQTTLVTVERMFDGDLMADEMTAAGTLPALYVTDVAVATRGAWPLGLWGEYEGDVAEQHRYAQAARTPEGFATYMASNVQAGAA